MHFRSSNLAFVRRTCGGMALAALMGSSSLLALCGGPALAQDGTIQTLEAEIRRMEARHQAEIKALQDQIKQLRKDRTVVAAPLAQPAHGTPPVAAVQPGAGQFGTERSLLIAQPVDNGKVIISQVPGYHFGFADASGWNTIELVGRLHIDTGGYPGFQASKETLDQKGLAYGIDLRRARIGVTGNIMDDWRYSFIYDFGNTSDGYNGNNALANANSNSSPTASNNYLAGIENAFITYNGFYKHGQQFPIAFDFGIQDVPWTLEEATSSNDLMFMERSSSQVIATLFGGGDFRSSLGFRSNNDRYWVGAFLTGPNSGALHTNGASCNTGTVAVTAGTPCVTSAQQTGLGPQLAFLGRAAYQIVQEKDATLHIGFNFANLIAPRVGANEDAIQLTDRPELRIDPTTFLNTGNIPARGGQVFGAEAAASWGHLFVQGEYYRYVIETRADVTGTPGNLQGGIPGPTLNFNGGYVEASYSFGGQRYYNSTTAAYSGVIPEHPLAPGSNGLGALEAATRFSIVDLNSSSLTTGVLGSGYSAPGISTGGTTTYGGGKQTSYGVGLNWYPNNNLKFMLDYEHVVVDNPQYYGGPNTWRGATIDWIAGRSQIVF